MLDEDDFELELDKSLDDELIDELLLEELSELEEFDELDEILEPLDDDGLDELLLEPLLKLLDESDEELDKLDRADCRTLPDGNYWLNRRSGTWGFAGERMVQGRIGDGCRANKRAVPKSRSIARPAAEPGSAGSPPEEGITGEELRREEPITGTSPLLRVPEPEAEKP